MIIAKCLPYLYRRNFSSTPEDSRPFKFAWVIPTFRLTAYSAGKGNGPLHTRVVYFKVLKAPRSSQIYLFERIEEHLKNKREQEHSRVDISCQQIVRPHSHLYCHIASYLRTVFNGASWRRWLVLIGEVRKQNQGSFKLFQRKSCRNFSGHRHLCQNWYNSIADNVSEIRIFKTPEKHFARFMWNPTKVEGSGRDGS